MSEELAVTQETLPETVITDTSTTSTASVENGVNSQEDEPIVSNGKHEVEAE